MIGTTIDVAAAAIGTLVVMMLPGAAAIAAMRGFGVLAPALRPAAAVTATILVAAPLLVLTFALQWSITAFALLLVSVTLALLAIALTRLAPGEVAAALRGVRAGSAAAYGLPTVLMSALAVADAPQVRSDTYWHVGLARKLSELADLSSSQVAFGAGTPGNSGYPLPVWHALVAVADQLPRVDVWFASWFLTAWLAPVAMLAFGAVAATLTGHRRATLAGAWTFLAIVVLGYGPWFFASRYLGYPGQVAIFVVLPILLWAFVRLLERDHPRPRALVVVLVAASVAVGVLHANYALYPALFTLGAATLLLVGARDGARRAFALAGLVVGTGAATLAVQLPWIMHDANFLRGDTPPDGAPSAFIRHRDVLTGSEELFWLKLGALATQPWLVAGALAIPVLLLVLRRRFGPWVLAGAAIAIVVTARTPWIVQLIDAAGSITPVTRLDRVYPAAIGTLAIALLLGRLLERARWSAGARAAAWSATLAACAVGTWWVDSIRDTRRIVVTPFVEARWVGGLDPMGLPLVAVWCSTVLALAVAIGIRIRQHDRSMRGSRDAGRHALASRFATLFVVAIVVGLAPASAERLHAAFEPQAYDRSARADDRFVRVEVYPARLRRAVERLEPRSVVLADLANSRRVPSLVPVYVVGESIARELEEEPVRSVEAARERLREPSEDVPAPDYLVVDRANEALFPLVEAARACGWIDRSAGGVWIYERAGDRCFSGG